MTKMEDRDRTALVIDGEDDPIDVGSPAVEKMAQAMILGRYSSARRVLPQAENGLLKSMEPDGSLRGLLGLYSTIQGS